MYDPRRLSGLLFAALPIALCLSFGSVLVKVYIGSDPKWKSQGDFDYHPNAYPDGYKILGPGRVSCMLRDKLDQRSRGSTELGLIVGTSHLAGIDTGLLDESLGVKWIPFWMGACDIRGLSMMERLIEVGEIAPNFVIIGITPRMFVVSRDFFREPVFSEPDHAGRLAKIRNDVGRSCLAPVYIAFPDRARFNNYVQTSIIHWRVDFFKRLGPGFEAGFRPWPVAWAPPPSLALDDKAVEWQLKMFREHGALEAKSYPADSIQEISFIKLINGYRTHGAKVIVVVMPESSRLRSLMPREAVSALDRALQCVHQEPSILVIDLWTFVPDDEFIDLSHVNAMGCERETKHLIEAVAPFVDKPRRSHVSRP
jgi:hypothetical protein